MENTFSNLARIRKKYLLLAAVAAIALTARADEIRTGGTRVLENPSTDGNLVLRVNDGGVKTDALIITGSTGGVSAPVSFSTPTMSSTTAFRAPDGTEGTPTYSFTNDTDSGVYRSASDTLSFSTGAQERVQVTSAGELRLVNTASEQIIRLEPDGSITARRAGGAPAWAQQRFNGTFASPTVAVDGDLSGTMGWTGYSAAAVNTFTFAEIRGVVDGVPDSGGDTSDMPGRIEFRTVPDGTTSMTERMRIDNAGRVGIGLTPAASGIFQVRSGSSGATANVNSVAVFEGSGTDPVLQIMGTNTSNQHILFGDVGNNGAGEIGYAHATDTMSFVTNGSAKLSIGSAGNVSAGSATGTNLQFNESTTENIPQINITQSSTGDAGIGFVISGVTAWNVGIDNSDSDSFVFGHDGGGAIGGSTTLQLDTNDWVHLSGGTNGATAGLTFGKNMGGNAVAIYYAAAGGVACDTTCDTEPPTIDTDSGMCLAAFDNNGNNIACSSSAGTQCLCAGRH